MQYRPTGTLTKVQAGSAAGTMAGAFVTILVWLLENYAHVEVPIAVVGALITIFSGASFFVTAYLVPLLPGEVVPVTDHLIDQLTPESLERIRAAIEDHQRYVVPNVPRVAPPDDKPLKGPKV